MSKFKNKAKKLFNKLFADSQQQQMSGNVFHSKNPQTGVAVSSNSVKRTWRKHVAKFFEEKLKLLVTDDPYRVKSLDEAIAFLECKTIKNFKVFQ